MTIRLLMECDNCGQQSGDYLDDARRVESLTLDLGDGARRVELCSGCQEVAGLGELLHLLREYGADLDEPKTAATGRASSSPSSARRKCPVCRIDLSGRAAALVHLQSVHGMSIAEASRACPPSGATETCDVCGYVAQKGNGFAVHRSTHD